MTVWEIQEAELMNALRLKAFWEEISPEQAEIQIGLLHDRQKRGLYVFPRFTGVT